MERFIRGREVTVGLIGNRGTVTDSSSRQPVQFLPTLEVDLAAYPPSEGGVYTNRMKTEWANDFRYHCPAPLSAGQIAELNRLALAAFQVTGCADVARVDFRLDADDGDRPYILEVNPLPGLYPGLSDLVLAATAMDMPYNALINAILDAARVRVGL